MTTLEKIEREIEALGPEELKKFRAWFAEFDAAQWDAQIAADAISGRLDDLGNAALAAHRAKRTTPL
jgi:hypothetical protein